MSENFYQTPAAEALVQAQVDLARLESEVSHLTEIVAELKASNKAVTEKLDQIQRTLAEARGGWRTMMWMGGAAASVGGFVTWLATHVTWRG